ncbi:MAG: ribonuclease G [Gammaproteobacteria bacterium]|nr:ribonuclease G [Gammaproteobacteria bacterium]
MSEELLINVTPRETRIAIVENGVLQEVQIERANRRGLVGNIYKGKVSRVLPGMQAAFVEIGLERTAFLHASDIDIEGEEEGGKGNEQEIVKLLRQGQDVLVQVIKDPIGTKGARLSTHISLPSRYLVYMPNNTHIGISQKLENEDERNRLKNIISENNEAYGGGGYIIRTVAEGISEEAVKADMAFLQRMWGAAKEKIPQTRAGNLVYEDPPLVMRVMRDLVGGRIEKMRIDSNETYNKVNKFAKKFIPELEPHIEYYPGERPIFDIYGVEDEIHKALERKVELKSGGYLIIDQTEAMTTIDVNTGGFVGHRNLEETIFKTNLEAAQAIVRQLRLRNLGGIIIIDFIDMIDAEHRNQVMEALDSYLEKDTAKTNICDVSPLGLVEMTRKRTSESLEHILCETCPTCQGRGTIKTTETVCYDIFREILREERQYKANEYLVLASQEVVDRLLDEDSTSVAELETFIEKSIRFQVESLYTQEQFDVVLM